MLHLREAAPGDARHALRRRVRGDERGVGGFEREKLPEERIEGLVVDLRGVVDVVEPLVALDLAPQPGGAGGGIRRAHGRDPG